MKGRAFEEAVDLSGGKADGLILLSTRKAPNRLRCLRRRR